MRCPYFRGCLTPRVIVIGGGKGEGGDGGHVGTQIIQHIEPEHLSTATTTQLLFSPKWRPKQGNSVPTLPQVSACNSTNTGAPPTTPEMPRDPVLPAVWPSDGTRASPVAALFSPAGAREPHWAIPTLEMPQSPVLVCFHNFIVSAVVLRCVCLWMCQYQCPADCVGNAAGRGSAVCLAL